ncbi:MAG: SufD family Fe-S cluster assembly protein [Fibromonadaceae bacterium]|jgi:Fe-S cluster assembly protein SufD|nr:SufD family Fe-S cluster assembly protein [Fibromonadaceae bacterium]
MNNFLWMFENNCEKFSLRENEQLSVLTFNSQSDICVELCGEGAVFEYRSLSVFGEDKKTEQKINVVHKAPNTKSFLFARHILNDNSRAFFNGVVEVDKHCVNISSKQLVNSILLSPSAKVVSKPELKIYCDEVECSHGNTCGSLDEDSLFFLQSRGMDFEQAEKILLNAFAAEVAKEHPNEEQKSLFLNRFSCF